MDISNERQFGEENIHQLWIKMFSGFATNRVKNFTFGPSLLVATLVGERVKHVGNGDKSCK